MSVRNVKLKTSLLLAMESTLGKRHIKGAIYLCIVNEKDNYERPSQHIELRILQFQ